MNRPFLWVCISLIGGIGFGAYLSPPVILPLALSGLFLCLSLAAFFLHKESYLKAFVLLCIFSFATCLSLRQEERINSPDPLSKQFGSIRPQPALLRGRIIAEPLPFEEVDKIALDLEVEAFHQDNAWHPIQGLSRLSWYEPDLELQPGDKVEVDGRIREAEGLANPLLPSYKLLLNKKGIYTLLTASGQGKVRKIGQSPLPFYNRAVKSLRNRVKEALEQTMPQSSQGLLLALLVGMRAHLSEQAKEALKETGTFHILAISGLHVGIVYSLLYFLLLGLRLGPRLRALLILLLIAFYALFTGGQVPVVRAAIMLALYVSAPLFRRESDLLNSLLVAASFILLISPMTLFEASFQLSFVAVVSIILMSHSLQEALAWLLGGKKRAFSRGPAAYFISLMAVTLSAQIGLLPLIAHYFHILSLSSFLANLMVVPLLSVVLGLGFLTLFSAVFFPPLAKVFGLMNHLFISFILWITETLSVAPLSHFPLASPSVFSMLSYFGLLGFSFKGNMLKGLRYRIALLLLAFVLLLHPQFLNSSPGFLEATIFDVGNGDSILLLFPHGESMLIDGGFRSPSFDCGEKVVGPFLWKKGIKRLDAMVLTHPHSDHLGGLPFILRNFSVSQVIDSGQVGDSPLYEEFMSLVREKGIPISSVKAGDEIEGFREVRIRVLNPPEVLLRGSGSEVNNNSVVLRIEYGEVNLLLAADIEKEAEEALRQRWPELLSASILKVPHQGSLSSNTEGLIRAVRPSLAMISAGRLSPFEHPHREVLKRYASTGATLLRTDLHGGITVRVRKKDFSYSTVRQVP